MKYHIAILAAALLISCGDTEPVKTATPCHVKMYGDSITHQAGQTINQFLLGCTVENLGVDASILDDVLEPIMYLDKALIYTFSYGANECIGGRKSVSEFTSSLNHLAVQSIGHRVIIEAPWNLTHPACDAKSYRQAALDVGAKFNMPVVIEDSREHIGDDVHIPYSHTFVRAKALADAINSVR